MLLKFEHPTIDEMEVVKSLSPCVKFPVVAVYDPESAAVLKEDLKKAEKFGLYSAIEWDSFSADVNASEVKTLVSTGGAFSPIRWTHEKIDRSLKERLLRILFRNFVASHEYDIVFGESDTIAKRTALTRQCRRRQCARASLIIHESNKAKKAGAKAQK